MKINRLVTASFRHYWRGHLGLFFGVFLAAAVIGGSLLVGDSVRASLRKAAGERLGKVEAGLLGGDRWFTEDLARKTGAAPLILLRGSVSESTGKARANAVQVLGVDDFFWKLGAQGDGSRVGRLLEPKDALGLNESLARRLGVKIGDTVLVRLEKPSAISRDAPLSGEANQDITLRRKVTAILGGLDFGNFQLQASQIPPDNVFLPLAELGEALGKKGRVNAMVEIPRIRAAGTLNELGHSKERQSGDHGRASEFEERIAGRLALEDFALKFTRVSPKSDTPTSDLRPPTPEWELTTDRVFLDDIVAKKILDAIPGSYGVLTYLVTGLSSAKGRVPYSMVTAIPAEVQDSRFRNRNGGPASDISHPGSENGIVINQWLADDLQVSVGDRVDIRYFTVGLGRDLKEQTAGFTVRGILPMADPVFNASWAPDFPGVTDAKNCRDWQPGIPMKLDAIRDKDEAYWKQYKTTPKAFINLADGQKLWSNRFGDLTAIRFPDTGQDADNLRKQLLGALRLPDIGLVARDFRAEAAAAAKGSVDFGGLFIGLSLFLIAASLVFSALLLLFTLESRAAQIGLLFSIGWPERQVRRSILWEAGLVASCGALFGLVGGLVYARCALAGLNGVWSGATAGLRLVRDFQPLTLAIAFASSLIVSLGTIWIATRRIFKARPKDLLAGDAWAGSGGAPACRMRPSRDEGAEVAPAESRGAFMRFLPGLFLLLAIGLSIAGARATKPEAVAGLFFGSGFCLLAAGLVGIRRALSRLDGPRKELRDGVERTTPAFRFRASAVPAPSSSLAGLGLRNITRRPGRSLAVIGMMAGGIFLVIAVNAFRLGAESDPSNRASGTGGFALIGESTLPVYEDLNTSAAWEAFALDDKMMKDIRVIPFRVREGDDASCLNLNKAQRPVLCGVNPAVLADRKAFAFAKGSWGVLAGGSKSEIPAIADQATAMWGLGKGLGDTIEFTDAQGRAFDVKIAGLLAGSVLQGRVIISEYEFLRKFPDTAGYKFFLVDAPVGKAAEVRAHLSRQLGGRGLALEATADRLAAFNAVQNTYIGIFTVLGGLGVLLGTLGLGVLAMRNVLERRGEFGLMQALGFRPRALRAMVVSEHAALLATGLLLGIVSAAIAVWPNVKQSVAALPYAFLFWLNLGILAFGIAACWLAAVLALRGRLLDAVRRE